MPAKIHGYVRGTAEQRKVFRAWSHAKERCFRQNHPEYHRYGARGITVCPQWVDDFVSFAEHVGMPPTLQHSLDRIDNDKGYEPGNVRWATAAQQNANKRQGNQKPVRTLAVLSEVKNMHKNGMSTRKIAALVGLKKSQVWKAVSGYYDE